MGATSTFRFAAVNLDTWGQPRGQPGASAVAGTLLDWMLARASGRARPPTPGELGVRRVR